MKFKHYSFITICVFFLSAISCSKADSVPTNPGGGNTGACATATPGPLFTEVKAMMANNCVTCHNPTGQMPTVDFRDNCVIQNNAAQIKQRAVDLGTMPPTGALSQVDKNKITAWVTAGGRVTD